MARRQRNDEQAQGETQADVTNPDPSQAPEEHALSPQPPSSTDIAGIPFADEEELPPLPTVTTTQLAREQEKANGGGSSIHDAINNMRQAAIAAREANRDAVGQGAHVHRPEIKPLTPEEEAAIQPKRYRVLEQSPGVRAGGRTFTLYAGKVIDENNYDINHLRRSGVKLEQVVDG